MPLHTQEDECTSQGCCWVPHTDDNDGNVPWCFYPTADDASVGYNLTDYTLDDDGLRGTLTVRGGGGTDSLGTDITTLALDISFQCSGIARVHITDASADRWEIPTTVVPDGTSTAAARKAGDESLKYALTFTEAPFTFALTRTADGVLLFNSSNDLVFKDQYVKMTTSLDATSSLFGLGEATRTDGLKLEPGLTATLWNRDT